MLYNPRTVALVAELFHPQMNSDPAPIQRVHNEMFRSGDPAYSSFSVTVGGSVLSNPTTQQNANSYAAFLPDRFQFREELSSLTYDTFATRVRQVTEQVSKLRNIQVFTAQHVTIRTLVNPRHFKDSRAFLKQGMFGFGNEIESFGRQPQLFGIRLVFPPEEGRSSAYALRIESYSNDPRSLYIENQASYGPILVEQGLASVESNIIEAYDFVVKDSLRFVGCFDAPLEQQEEEAGDA